MNRPDVHRPEPLLILDQALPDFTPATAMFLDTPAKALFCPQDLPELPQLGDPLLDTPMASAELSSFFLGGLDVHKASLESIRARAYHSPAETLEDDDAASETSPSLYFSPEIVPSEPSRLVEDLPAVCSEQELTEGLMPLVNELESKYGPNVSTQSETDLFMETLSTKYLPLPEPQQQHPTPGVQFSLAMQSGYFPHAISRSLHESRNPYNSSVLPLYNACSLEETLQSPLQHPYTHLLPDPMAPTDHPINIPLAAGTRGLSAHLLTTASNELLGSPANMTAASGTQALPALPNRGELYAGFHEASQVLASIHMPKVQDTPGSSPADRRNSVDSLANATQAVSLHPSKSEIAVDSATSEAARLSPAPQFKACTSNLTTSHPLMRPPMFRPRGKQTVKEHARKQMSLLRLMESPHHPVVVSDNSYMMTLLTELEDNDMSLIGAGGTYAESLQAQYALSDVYATSNLPDPDDPPFYCYKAPAEPAAAESKYFSNGKNGTHLDRHGKFIESQRHSEQYYPPNYSRELIEIIERNSGMLDHAYRLNYLVSDPQRWRQANRSTKGHFVCRENHCFTRHHNLLALLWHNLGAHRIDWSSRHYCENFGCAWHVYGFPSSGELNRHTKTQHEETTSSYDCSGCGKPFSRADSCKRHTTSCKPFKEKEAKQLSLYKALLKEQQREMKQATYGSSISRQRAAAALRASEQAAKGSKSTRTARRTARRASPKTKLSARNKSQWLTSGHST